MRNDPTAEKVRDHLLNSGVRHGEKLPTERALAEQFGVSRNVIRRALLAMEVVGRIVRKVGNGTYFVESTGTPAAAGRSTDAVSQELALRDVNPRQILEARIALEPSLAALAAINCTGADLEHLIGCAQNYHQAQDFESYERADEAFHRAIALATHNSVLIRAYDAITAANAKAEWGKIRQRFLTAERRVFSRHEHDAILTALRERDAAAADKATRAHLRCVESALLRQAD